MVRVIIIAIREIKNANAKKINFSLNIAPYIWEKVHVHIDAHWWMANDSCNRAVEQQSNCNTPGQSAFHSQSALSSLISRYNTDMSYQVSRHWNVVKDSCKILVVLPEIVRPLALIDMSRKLVAQAADYLDVGSQKSRPQTLPLADRHMVFCE